MNKEIESLLPEVQALKKANEGYCYFDLFAFIGQPEHKDKLTGDLWAALSELFLPELIQQDGHIFVKERFEAKQSHYVRYRSEGLSPQSIEYWINTYDFNWYFFSQLDLPDQLAKYLAEKVRLGWDLKVKADFPNLPYEALLLNDPENGVLGVTLRRADLKI